MYCIVKHCGTTWKPKSDVKFHNVPKDERRRQHWLSIVPIKGKISQRSTICGLHFKPEDYNPERPGRLLSSAHPYYIPQPCDCFDTKACTTVRSTQTISQQDLRLLKTRESEKNDGHTHVKEEPGLSLEESCVKSEPGEYGEQVIKTEPLSELDADHVIEIEPYTEHVVKTEPLSELYSDHVVKDELVLGPERPHRPLPGLVHEQSNWAVPEKPAASETASGKSDPDPRRPDAVATACHLFPRNDEHILLAKPYSCIICKKNFRDLSAHMRMHAGVKPYSCNICEKKFPTTSRLTTHKRIHAGLKPFICKLCEKKFTTVHTLKTHVLTHTGEKPFSCEMCQKKFTKLQSLQIHVRIHTGERPFSCELCQKKFTQWNGLNYHRKTEVCKKKKN